MSRRLLGWFGLALALAVAVRLPPFLLARSLWMDEAMLALNIAARGFAGLLRPLDYDQAAPVGFLVLERAAVASFGVHEQSLRALSLIAGLATVLLIGLAGRRLYGEAAGVLAALLAALSPTLVRYSNEVKPYSTDALATTTLLLLALRAAEGRKRDRGWLVAGGTLALLLSFPAVIAAGAALLSLAALPALSRPRLTFFCWCAAAWGLAVAIPYHFVYSEVAGSAAQQLGYSYALLTPGPEFWARAWLAARGSLLPAFAGDGAGIPPAPPAVVAGIGLALAVGALRLAREHGLSVTLLAVSPCGIAFALSALRLYPLGVPRLMLFAVPLVLLLAAGAIDLARSGLRRRLGSRAAAAVAFSGALIVPSHAAWLVLRTPYLGEEARELLTAWRSERRGTQEPVYVNTLGYSSWLFYTTNWEEVASGHAGFLNRLAFYARAARAMAPRFESRPRERYVDGEGDELVYEFRGRREILGLFSGRGWSWPAYTRPGPLPGWAANEARRIHAAAVRNPENPCAWLYFTRMSERSFKPVTWHLRDAYGGERDFVFSAVGGAMWRFCFRDTPPPTRTMEEPADTDG